MLPVDERGSDGGGRRSSGGSAPASGSGERAHNFAVDCVAGGVAGLVADLIMHPLDTIKARLQVQVSMRSMAGGREGASEYRPRPYRGVWDCALRVYREQGVRRGLYAGLSAVLLGSVPASALTFGSYKLIKSVLPGEEAWMGGGGTAWWRDLTAASVADVAALVTYVPAEVVAKRLQVAGMGPARDYTSPVQALRVIARTEGIWRGVYAGTGATLLRDMPFTALQFAFFEQLKALLGPSAWTPDGLLLCGLAAGAGAGAATTPLDVVKTRLQTQPTGADRPYTGVWQCLRTIATQEGPQALFKGIGPRILWVAPASAITLSVYESAIQLLQPRRYERVVEAQVIEVVPDAR